VPLSETPFTDSTLVGDNSDIPENTASSQNELFGGPEFATSLTGGGTMNIAPQINENFEACQSNFGTCSLIVNEGGGALVFHYPPTISGEEANSETGTDETSFMPASDSLTVIGHGFEGFEDETIGIETPRLFISVPQTIASTEGGGLMMLGGAATGSNDPGALVDAGSLFEAHELGDLLLQNQMNMAGGGNAGASSSFSYPSTDGSFLFTGNDSRFGVVTPVAPPGSTTFETGNGNRVHVDGSVSGLPGAEGVDSTVSVKNRGDGGTSFVLLFSEPMDKDTVEDNFTIRSFDSTVIALDGGTISGNTATPNNSDIWDQGGYDVDWNSDDTEVTFTFSERQLPSDGDSEDFLVSFDGQANDPAGWRADFDTPMVLVMPDEVDSASQTAIFITLLIRAMESDPQAAATRITDLETVGSPNFDFEGGFESGNTASWPR
jgi:hypothetical protein